MDYLMRNPGDIRAWLDKEKKFDSLSWVWDRLPNKELRKQLFDTLNDISHANFRNIDALSTFNLEPNHKIISVGPLPFPPSTQNPISLAANLIAYPVRILWLSEKDAVSSVWISDFHQFDSATGFLLGENWTAQKGDDLATEPSG